MAVLSLPLNFTNSFWSQDYISGLSVLFNKLEQGVAENDEIIAFIRARAAAEAAIAAALSTTPPSNPHGFAADDGASLLMAFRGLQQEAVSQGQSHNNIAKDLGTLVVDPFDEWAQQYKERLKQNRATVIDNWLHSYQLAQNEVAKLKNQYLAKTRRADEQEDDAKFAPNNDADTYTTSPLVRPADSPRRAPPQRSATMSERIANRLKEIQRKSADAIAAATSPSIVEEPEELFEAATPSKKSITSPLAASPLVADKGKSKAIGLDSPPPLSPLLPPPKLSIPETIAVGVTPFLLAGLAFPPAILSQLLKRAASELPLRPVRFPLLGEYQDCFSGEEFVAWLRENVQGFDGSFDRAEDAAKELTERDGLLRRLGELGNQFEHSDEAFYQFRAKAFDLETKHGDPISAVAKSPMAPKVPADSLMKRTGALVNLVGKAINNVNAPSEPAWVRARRDAEESEKLYRMSVRKLDRRRLALEERLEETLKTLQRWERERLQAVKTVLLQYQGTISGLPKSFEGSMERSSTLIAAFQPESDLIALIERYRTGPFRPLAPLYESLSQSESDVVFGLDLRKWAEGGWDTLSPGEPKKPLVPPVLTGLLEGLKVAYEKLPNDAEKRKAWIYEVPLPATHHLREALNDVPFDRPIPLELVSEYDAAVIANAIKLWLLELNPPIALYEGWEDFRKIYPTVGSATKGDPTATEEDGDDARIRDVSSALLKLPRVHLYVLDEVVKHIRTLIDETAVEETDEVYTTKIALSVGRTILRPKVETELSIQDRHHTLLFIDLVNNYSSILPGVITRKKRESERKVPSRKPTAPVDMRLSRSKISLGADAAQLLAAQQVAQNPSLAGKGLRSPDLSKFSPPTGPVVLQPPPPPPPVVAAVIPPPPPPLPDLHATTLGNNGLPPRPVFQDIRDDTNGLPPMPKFAEPGSESDDEGSTTASTTAPQQRVLVPPPPPPPISLGSPPNSASSSPVILPPPPPQHFVPPPPPPTFGRPTSPVSTSAVAAARAKLTSRSPSPTTRSRPSSVISTEDTIISTNRPSVTRSGSNTSSTTSAGIRGPRIARGPRGPTTATGGTVSSMANTLNRNSVGGVSSPPNPHRLSGSPVRRPSSVLGRSAGALSRRTMASDAEDDVVDRK